MLMKLMDMTTNHNLPTYHFMESELFMWIHQDSATQAYH